MYHRHKNKQTADAFSWRQNTQHNDIQHNYTQHEGHSASMVFSINYAQHNNYKSPDMKCLWQVKIKYSKVQFPFHFTYSVSIDRQADGHTDRQTDR